MMSKDEINRYSRHILLSEIGMKGQEKLKKAKVLVVGAGGLGCPVLQYLAAAGTGTIGIVDDDAVDETNLHRQILFSTEDVGKHKAEVAKNKLSKLNPFIHIIAHVTRLTSQNALDLLRPYDIVIDGSDNFPTRYLVNDACVMLNKPLVFGSIYKFEGQVSVFNYKDGPTYRCLFPEPPQDSPNCAEIGVLGVLPGLIGTFMANETLKIILDIGRVLSGRLLVLDALTVNTQVMQFEKKPNNTNIDQLIDYEAFCGSPAPSGKQEEEKEISAGELKQMIESNADFQLIDVREKLEYLLHNLKGVNIPLSSIEKNVSKIARDKKVVVHCKSGVRSRKAIEILEKEYGFTNLINLKGGIDAYR